MKRKNASISDIAAHCNLSKSTVSRVLNNQMDKFAIAEKTIERVRAVADELGYRPSRLARALTSRRSYLIGVSFPRSLHHREFNIEDSHATEFQSFGAYTYTVICHPLFQGYDLVIHYRNDFDPSESTTDCLNSDLLDGMIFFNPASNLRAIMEHAPKWFPVVIVGHPEEDILQNTICVDVDNRSMAREATLHLLNRGRNNPIMLLPRELESLFCMKERIAGFADALSQRGIPHEHRIVYLPSPLEKCRHELGCQLQQKHPDCIFSATDDLAATAMDVLQTDQGRRIPEEVMVIGFSNTALCAKTVPTLSSVDVSVSRIAYQAAEELLSVLEKKKPFTPGFYPVPSELVLRESAP